jgi:hypothetical protein
MGKKVPVYTMQTINYGLLPSPPSLNTKYNLSHQQNIKS